MTSAPRPDSTLRDRSASAVASRRGRGVRVGVVGVVVSGVVVGGLVGAVPVGGVSVGGVGRVGGGVESVGPLSVVSGSGSGGVVWPVSVVSGGVALSPRPVVVVSGVVPAGVLVGGVDVDVVDVSVGGGAGGWSWSGRVDGSGRFVVGRDVVAGHAYVWRWRSGSGSWVEGGSFVAKFGVGSGEGATSVGGASVSLVTGEVGVGWSSGVVVGPGSSVSAGLEWRSGRVGVVPGGVVAGGVPSGWRLMVGAGSPWMGVSESSDGVVRGVAPGAPRVVVSGGGSGVSARVSWRARGGGVRVFVVQVFLGGRWVSVGRVSGEGGVREFSTVVGLPVGVGVGARVRVVGVVGRGLMSTRFALASPVRVFSGVSRVEPVAGGRVGVPLAGPVRVSGAGEGSLVVAGAAPARVTLWGWDGSALTFLRNASGVYEQVRTAGSDVVGMENSLVRRELVDGVVWEFTDVAGTVTSFRDGRVVSVVAGGMPVSTVGWDGDRVVWVRPGGVAAGSGQELRFVYGGSGGCASESWSGFGFASVPAGLLCRVSYPDGSGMDVGYVGGVAGGVQVGLVKESGDRALALGWDSVGRLVGTRGALAGRGALVDPALAGLVSSIGYDSKGRAAVLTDAPVRVGGPVLVERVSFPSWTVDQVVAGQEVAVRSDYSVGSASWSSSLRVDALSQRPVGGTDRAGLGMKVQTDRLGRPQLVTDPRKREVSYRYDEFGMQTGQSGPFVGDASRGLVMDSVMDADVSQRRSDDWQGLRVMVFPEPGFAGVGEGAWWGRSGGQGLAVSWSRLPDGAGSRWSARASGSWDPGSDARDWQFKVESSGAQVSLLVEGEACVPDSSGVCVIKGLPVGVKSVVVQVDQARSQGGFTVSAGPVGQPVGPVAGDAVAPRFGLVTGQRVNDTYDGSVSRPTTSMGYEQPWTQQVTSSTSAGGLTVSREYEPVDPDRGLWGRLLSRTTPGGQVERLEYWGDDQSAAAPGVCGVPGRVLQWGQLKQVTRQDGSVQQGWRDAAGRLVAVQVRSGASTRTTCLGYDVAGDMVRREVFGSGGRLIERTVVDTAVGGKPWVVKTTVTHGPAAPVAPGTSVSSVTTYDMAGRPVRHVDEFGTVTTTTYTVQGSPKQVVITAPSSTTGAGRSMTLGFDYTVKQNWLQQVTVNGVVAAQVAYDENRAQIQSIVYADGTVTADYDYFGNGSADQLTVTTPSSTWVHQAELTAAGRVIGTTLTATGDRVVSETRDYQYDTEARLVGTQITTSRDAGPTSTVDWTYSYGPQDPSCVTDYAAGDDNLRTGGTRDGVAYITCHDTRGRTTRSTDPLLGGTATITHDDYGRVTQISGPGPDTRLTWGADTQLAILADAGTTTTLNTYAGQIHSKTLTTPTTTTTLGYAYAGGGGTPVMLLGLAGDGSASSVRARQVGLPGGAVLSMPTGGKAVLQLSDLDGAALVTLPVPVFGDGPVSDLVERPGAADRFGPYGEPLQVPSWSSAAPQRGWQSKAGFETLAGGSSVTLMGARPYHPVLGEFLAVDPDPGASTNLYSYTSGDPISRGDATGQSEDCGILCTGLSSAALLANFFGGAIYGAGVGLVLSAVALGMANNVRKSQGDEGASNSMEVAFAAAVVAMSGLRILAGVGAKYFIARKEASSAWEAVKGTLGLKMKQRGGGGGESETMSMLMGPESIKGGGDAPSFQHASVESTGKQIQQMVHMSENSVVNKNGNLILDDASSTQHLSDSSEKGGLIHNFIMMQILEAQAKASAKKAGRESSMSISGMLQGMGLE